MLSPSEKRLAKGLYWDRAWSLVEGCTPVSPGCDNCWAAQAAHLRAQNPNPKVARANADLTDSRRFTGNVRIRPDLLDLPLKTVRPTVWSIWTDLFHEAVPEPFIDDVLDYIAACPQHVFLVLTKRPENIEQKLYGFHPDVPCRKLGGGDYLPNLWLGVTAENQEWFDRRWQYARLIPAAVHFVSHEPAMGPITYPPDFLDLGSKAWVITGGESGAGARPMSPDSPRSDRNQCLRAGVPFFFKHHGEYIHESQLQGVWPESRNGVPYDPLGRSRKQIEGGFAKMGRQIKKAAGRRLDGREWNEMPHVE